jgi:hypothetical protein
VAAGVIPSGAIDHNDEITAASNADCDPITENRYSR